MSWNPVSQKSVGPKRSTDQIEIVQGEHVPINFHRGELQHQEPGRIVVYSRAPRSCPIPNLDISALKWVCFYNLLEDGTLETIHGLGPAPSGPTTLVYSISTAAFNALTAAWAHEGDEG